MPIEVRLKILLAERKKTARELAEYVGITPSNLSLLSSGKVNGIRFNTLQAICEFLDCQPGDLLVNIHKPEKHKENQE
ncbi:helix-turn-helix domain-containing protein [Cohaesibacter gelatinilyticus]|uniref:Putative transcriptional regulator n=1 Tax=Cohaesibacter gelatinilyticus TaxID=372072 RepID=A0A285PHK2_9HYPH|nr:helix-turn-helix transcriptional regulator [Cohaesibacter gelatinilyticus]SNZ21209.1 putative transcriptional regulator [Cohaesibacter gelatinilyticus]HAT87976.1 transcriptional regulator [Hyphomicrobiales bacterium]